MLRLISSLMVSLGRLPVPLVCVAAVGLWLTGSLIHHQWVRLISVDAFGQPFAEDCRFCGTSGVHHIRGVAWCAGCGRYRHTLAPRPEPVSQEQPLPSHPHTPPPKTY